MAFRTTQNVSAAASLVRIGLFGVALAAVAFLSYAPVLSAPLASDDWGLVLGTRTAPLSWGWGGFVRPLILLSLAADWRLYGTGWAGYHLTNVLWHVLASLGAAWIAMETARCCGAGEVRARRCGALGGLAFAALASHSEAVAWVAGRTDVIAAAFSFAGFALSLRLVRCANASAWLSPLAAVFFAAGLLAKESVIPNALLWLPVALVVLPSEARHRWRIVAHFVVCTLVLVGYFVLRWQVLGTCVGGYGSAVHLNTDPLILLKNCIKFGVRMVLPPLPFASGGDWHAATVGGAWFTCFGIAVAAAAWLVAREWRRGTEVAFWSSRVRYGLLVGVWTLGALTPVLGMGVSFLDTQGERFLYAPSVFVVSLGAFLLVPLLERRAGRLAVFALLALHMGAASVAAGNWAHAGRLCVKLVKETSRLPRPSGTVFVNVLDNYRGAYVFRNAFGAAHVLLGGRVGAESPPAVLLHSVWYSDRDPELQTTDDIVRLTVAPPCVIYGESPGTATGLPSDVEVFVSDDERQAEIRGIAVPLRLAAVRSDGTAYLLDPSGGAP